MDDDQERSQATRHAERAPAPLAGLVGSIFPEQEVRIGEHERLRSEIAGAKGLSRS